MNFLQMQTTSHVLMIEPINFGFNGQTAGSNTFQTNVGEKNIQELALAEFNEMVNRLRNEDIDVTVIQDTAQPHTPDSIFPNNWVSFHANGSVVLYPMFAKNRREERKEYILQMLEKRFEFSEYIDLTGFEESEQYLEGTGSMIFDRKNKIAYACLSPRTMDNVFYTFCQKLNFLPVLFHATNKDGIPIYHTNVMMCVADEYAIICLESIWDNFEKQYLTNLLKSTGKEIISIRYDQLSQFAGNMLQVQNKHGEKILVMSSAAFNSLDEQQITQIQKFNRILHSPIPTIETNGGGSTRCMIAEIFTKEKSLENKIDLK